MTDATPARLDLAGRRRIHVVGVGGAGMSAIAAVLRSMGHEVSGSDLKESAGVERLRAQDIPVFIGHAAANVGDAEVLAVSSAVREDNAEVVGARSRGVPVVSRAEVLAAIAATRRTVAVSGTHGKTTTSSMLALVLAEAGLHPSFIIGGDVNEIGSGAVWDRGAWFVVEADESDGTFLALGAEAVVVTNVEADHLDHFGSLHEIEAAFRSFLEGAAGPRVVCADDPIAERLAGATGAVTYGLASDASYRIVDVATARDGASFGLVHGGREVARVELPVPGLHNIRNATAALVMGAELGASADAAVRALGRFGGVARRFEHRGVTAGITFIDDYAHNPGKVRAVMDAVASGSWPRVVVAFQPHRYSRTELQWREFASVFGAADVLAVTDVYGAGEAPRPGVSGMLIIDAVLEARPWRRVAYLPHRADLVSFLIAELRSGDLCLSLGAGDITTLADDVQAQLAARGGRRER